MFEIIPPPSDSHRVYRRRYDVRNNQGLRQDKAFLLYVLCLILESRHEKQHEAVFPRAGFHDVNQQL